METHLQTSSSASPKHSRTSSVESGKNPVNLARSGGVTATAKTSATVSTAKKKTAAAPTADLSVSGRSSLAMDAITSLRRRDSPRSIPEKHPGPVKTPEGNGAPVVARNVSPSASDPGVKSNLRIVQTMPPALSPKHVDAKKTSPISRLSSTSKTSPITRLSSTSDRGKTDSIKKPSLKPSLPAVSLRKASSLTDNSSGRGSIRRMSSNAPSPSRPPSPSVTSGLKSRSMSSSVSTGSVSSQKKSPTVDSRDSRLMMLPHVDVKASDELRLDLRGHRLRSLKAMKLTPNLEFVYLRDNLLSSVEGIEMLKRVKVLDLSFNDFKAPAFEPIGNCKTLQQLYLAGNQITSLASLPELPNLEFLSVAQNRLRTLCMASQPRLQVLAASRNKISTLKGFPHLPSLEHLRVEENPILEMSYLEAASVLLVGPTLKKFNDRDLFPSELEDAKLYPPHTTLCIRDGWEVCPPGLAADSTFSFLIELWKEHLPPGHMVKEAHVEQPFEEDVCRCHFTFTNLSSDFELALKYQWFLGDSTPTKFVPIADAVGEVYWPKHEDIGRCLKVECIPMLRDTEYSPIFAISYPVSSGTGCPKVMNLMVHGELVEGNVIRGSAEIAWCGGVPGKGVASWLRRRWNCSPVIIDGAEDEEYRLTADDINSSLVFMYTPVTEAGVKGEPQYAMTDFVKAAAPSVSNVQIIGDAIEGNTIKGIGEYFGSKEGPSKYQWMREKQNDEFLLVSSGTAEYTLNREDVGRRIKFVYIPFNFEGQEGEPSSFITVMVKKAPPKITNLKIIGGIREGNKVTATGTIGGGTEGSSKVQWFKSSSSSIESEHSLEALSTSKIAKAFRIPLGAVGCYIVAKYIPIAPDGETGEPAYVISEKVVETLPPSLNFVTITGEFCEGEMLTASYGYIGGHEGTSLYNWCLHETESVEGASIPEASGVLQYRITKDAIGKYISFECTPVRDDGTIGEPRTFLSKEQVRPGCPRLIYLKLTGKAIEGTTVVANKMYWGGEEGDSIFRWFLTTSDGSRIEIEDTMTASYTLSCNDIGFLLSVSCEPVRSDGAHGPVFVSENIGPVVPGHPTCQSLEFIGSMVEGDHLSFVADYHGGVKGNCIYEWFRLKDEDGKDKLATNESLDLTLEDVGARIELIFTPVRKDGLRGSPASIISDIIMPANPKGIQLVLPDCFEEKEITPLKTYYGGKEGIGKYIWYRTKEKLEELELINIISSTYNHIVGQTLTYEPSLEDVGYYLVLYWVPTRADGRTGDPFATITSNPVMAGLPVVSEVCLKEIESGIYGGEGKYYGGYEGSSLYSWYRLTNAGSMDPIDGANSSTYEVAEFVYNCRLLFGYTPVRSDGVAGELSLSEPSDLILPELLKVDMLSLKGKEVEGEVLTAVQIIPRSDVQKHVWDKYKKEINYQWFCSIGSECHSFELLASQSSCSYRLRYEDIGRCLKCECTALDVFGRLSEPASVVTAPISPGLPRIDNLEIEGRGFHTNLYAVRGLYTGGKEGRSKIQWLRSMVGSPDLISISGEVGRMYEANVDDVGYRLVAVYTPVREDGAEGQADSASTDPISVEPDVYKEVKQKMDVGSAKFEVLCDKDRSPKKAQRLGTLERRILEVNRKRVKVLKPGSKTSFPATEVRGTYAPPFHVELYRNDQHRFKIVVDSENEVDLMVQTRHMRDVIVLVIRGFAQKFNSTSLNSLLKTET